MVVTDIIIQNIKSIREPLIIQLSEKVTRIAGRNTAGKSAIVDALALFSGIYSMMDIKGLVSTDRPPNEISRVGIKFKDNTTLWAVIEGNTRVRYHKRDEIGEITQEWDNWEEEIGDMLGWKTIQKEKLCLNIKKAKVNLLIDTAPTTNANIMDYLCENRDLEIRISNLEEAHDKLRTSTRTVRDRVQYYQNRFDSTDAVDIFRVKTLYKRVQNLTFTRGILTNLSTVREHRETEIELSTLTSMQQLVQLQRYIKAKREQLQLDKEIERLDEVTNLVKARMYSEHKNLERYVGKDIGKLEELKGRLSALGMIRQAKKLTTLTSESLGERRALEQVDCLQLKINEVRALLKITTYRQMKETNQATELSLGKMGDMERILRNITEIRNYNRAILSEGQQRESLDRVKQIISGTETVINLSKMGYVIKAKEEMIGLDDITNKLLEILGEHDVCPLCNSKVDVDNLV